ncbi:MAG: FtsX-like permease family protein [Opitutales bacterium]
MSRFALMVRGLVFFRRTHFGVCLGAALSTALIACALVVGHSVNETLRAQAQLRIGAVDTLFLGQDRFFRAELGEVESGGKDNLRYSPAILAQGSVAADGGERRANQVQIVGAETSFWQLAPVPGELTFEADRSAFVNAALAEQIELEPGERVVIAVRLPSVISRDAPLADGGASVARLRVTVQRIVSDSEFGRFSLVNSPLPVPSLFLPRQTLQDLLDVKVTNAADPSHELPAANLILAGRPPPAASRYPPIQVSSQGKPADRLKRDFTATDAGFSVRRVEATGEWEILARNIFLDTPLLEHVRATFPEGHAVLTYFVNSLKANDRATPYSMATAVNPASVGFIPDDLQPAETVINQWLADDLGVGVGDSLSMAYFVPEPGGGLREDVSTFTIRAVLPMRAPQADPLWMPEFPGLADADNCRDWETGAPVDLDRVRDKDEDYWDEWRGSPKAFIALETGQRLWGNRWGAVTSYRFSTGTEDALSSSQIAQRLSRDLSPQALGFVTLAFAEEALAAAKPPNDFGGLLGGFSFFLIVAALALSALLFVFNLTQRTPELGMLRAVGWTRRQVRAHFLEEGGLLVCLGSLLGLPLGVGLAVGILAGLNSIWSSAAGGVGLSLHVGWANLPMAFFVNVGLALLALALVSWRLLRVDPVHALRGEAGPTDPLHVAKSGRRWLMASGVCWLTGLGLLGWSATQPFNPALYFSSAFALLLGGLTLGAALTGVRSAAAAPPTFAGLARLNNARRRGRSLTVAGALGAGVFMVVGAGAFLQPAQPEVRAPASGAGGFNLLAETAVPLPVALGDPDAASEYGLPESLLGAVESVPFRLVAGDEASCLNLSQAQQPRILGVDPAALRDRFTFAQAISDIPADWSALQATLPEGVLPAIVDRDTLLWSLKLPLGADLQLADEKGNNFTLRLVASVKDSVFQGSVIVDQTALLKAFPGLEGHSLFLLQTPPEAEAQVAAELSRALGDYGFAVTSTAQRLARFNAVENSYIAIFQALGGLGVVLGTASLGLVVLRNVLERRGELALLQATGFQRKLVAALLRREALWLIGIGLGSGLLTALLAILPALSLLQPGQIPWLAISLGLLTALAAWMAVRLAVASGLRAVSFDALREE